MGSFHLAHLADGEAAIDDDHFAGDVFGGGREQKNDGAGAILRIAEATLQNFLFVVGLSLRIAPKTCSGFRREDETGGDAIDADMVIGEFHRQSAHHHGDAAFGGVVGGGVDLGLKTVDRSGDDNGSGTFLGGEFLGEGLDGEIVGLEIEIDSEIPTLTGHFKEGRVVTVARIADEQVEIGAVGEGRFEEIFGTGFTEEIAGEVGRAGTRIRILGFEAVADDLGAGGVEGGGDGLPNATAGTGDESGVSGEGKWIRSHDRGSSGCCRRRWRR